MTRSQQFAQRVSTTYRFSPWDVKAALVDYARTCGVGPVPKGEVEVDLNEETGEATLIVRATEDLAQTEPTP